MDNECALKIDLDVRNQAYREFYAEGLTASYGTPEWVAFCAGWDAARERIKGEQKQLEAYCVPQASKP